MDHTTTIIESQLDWITCSNDGSDHREAFRAFGLKLLETEKDAGNHQHQFRLRRYFGWQAGRVRYAQSGERTLLALSGDLAERAFDTVYPMATNVSRLDAAVTIRLADYGPNLGREAYESAEQHWRPGARYPKPSIFVEPGHGSTFYLGNRASERHLRLYDKAAESKDAHYAACWRYEVESKGTLATSLALACASCPDRPALCQGYVHDAFRSRHVAPWFGESDERVLVRGFRRRSDTERSLAWLQSSVKPTLERLAARGLIREMYDALGL